MNFDHEELTLMMIYNTGTRLAYPRVAADAVLPDARRNRPAGTVGGRYRKLKLVTDAEFTELEFPPTDFCRLRAAYIGSFTMGVGVV